MRMRGRPRILLDKLCGCGIWFRPKASKIKNCSAKCSYLFRIHKGKIINCSGCGKEVYKKPCRLKAKWKTFFCSRKCQIQTYKKNAFRFSCAVCAKNVFTQPAQIKYRNRTTCSKTCAAVIKRKRALEKRQKYGYTKHQLDRLARYSPEAKKWKRDVFERDDFTCVQCYKRGGRLEADHIKPWAYFPDLRFVLSNGRTLCRKCHDKTKIGSKKMKEMYAKEVTSTT